MDKQELEIILAKYLDGVATEQEALIALDYLLESRRNREMFNMASVGFKRMKSMMQQ